MLQGFYIFHSYLIFAFVLAVLIKAPTFSMTPRCNRHAIVVIFGDIPALSIGRIITCISIGIVILIFTLLCVYDYKLPEQCEKISAWTEEKRKKTTSESDQGGDANQAYEKSVKRKSKNRDRYSEAIDDGMFLTGVDGRLIINLIIIVVLWAIFVSNSELSIVHNHFDGGGDGIGPAPWGLDKSSLCLFLSCLWSVSASLSRNWGLRSADTGATDTITNSDMIYMTWRQVMHLNGYSKMKNSRRSTTMDLSMVMNTSMKVRADRIQSGMIHCAEPGWTSGDSQVPVSLGPLCIPMTPRGMQSTMVLEDRERERERTTSRR
ncbi:hypothetical protein A7U60_g8026 [Sanghuangporus baumii]|uniref:Uncharacterized protein n=1 Tax=Sanghuangporus baumii TaxID=108892 RepID=A0A9Q5N5E5_SANBA|nr:hypothetical protein A7U60_g8026 [Sanghuangporus baumii]